MIVDIIKIAETRASTSNPHGSVITKIPGHQGMPLHFSTKYGKSGPSEAVRHGGGRRTENLQGEREKRTRREERKRKE